MARVTALLIITCITIALTSAGKLKEVKKTPKDSLKYTKEEYTESSSSELTVPPTFEETTDIRFLYQCLDQHNKYRKTSDEQVPEDKMIIYSTEVERIAQRRAVKLAVSGKITVDTSVIKSLSADGLAENVAFTSVPNMNSSSVAYINCRPIVDLWYTDAFGIEREDVPIETDTAMDIRSRTLGRKVSNSNLRNLIWTQADEIGCAQVSSFDKSNSGVYTLCNYRRSS